MNSNEINNQQEQELPAYEIPTLISYTDEDILDELGPAQANEYEVTGAIF